MADRLPLSGSQGIRGDANRGRHGSERFLRRDDHCRQHEQRQRQRAGDQCAVERQRHIDRREQQVDDQRLALFFVEQAEHLHERGHAQDAVNDRRHAGEVRQIDLNDLLDPAFVGVLFQIHRRADADRHREQCHEHDQPQATPQRRENPRLARLARVIAREKFLAQWHGALFGYGSRGTVCRHGFRSRPSHRFPTNTQQQHAEHDDAEPRRATTEPLERFADAMPARQIGCLQVFWDAHS